jgi:hypothetical protein
VEVLAEADWVVVVFPAVAADSVAAVLRETGDEYLENT